VKAFYYSNLNSTDKTVEEINQIAFEKGYVDKEDMLVNLTAMPIESKGMVNTLRVSVI
jgi:pyruvate kinase